MRFTVAWTRQARDDLAKLWTEKPDRSAITTAADEIDRVLANDPERYGVDFYGDRLLVVEPLAVVYAVSSPDRLVRVLQVWHS